MRRREFLILSAASIGGVLVYSLDRKAVRLSAQDDKTVRIPLRFFTQDEALIVAAAAARILPNDDTGPGAKEAGVAIFIDRQLAGPWGRDRNRYTQAPFQEDAAAEFGYQGKATPRDIYREALKDLKGFDSLPPSDQDRKLAQIESSLFFYTNPDGVSRAACVYCGFCERYGCMIGAKAQPTNTLLPVIAGQKRVSIRTGASVHRILHEKTKGGMRARGVTYVDAGGEEYFQPAEIVVIASWTLNNTRLLLLSGVGDPYDPATGKGSVGRNLTHQLNVGTAQMFFDKPLNRFMGSGGAGIRISDFDGDAFDHSGLPFLRGGTITAGGTGAQPIASFGAVPASVKSRWGSEWKKSAVYNFDRVAGLGFAGEHLAYRTNYMDLDPVYKDHLGDPLLRLTLDWHDNERKMAEFAIAKGTEIARAMGAKEVNPARPPGRYDGTRYQSTHVQGGTIMGKSPEHSVLNTYLQQWQTPNLFVLGASSFPQEGSANPTPTVIAFTYRTVDAIVNRYLKKPGPLA